MKTQTALFAITAIAASMVAIYLGWTLHVERTQREAAKISTGGPQQQASALPPLQRPELHRARDANSPASLDAPAAAQSNSTPPSDRRPALSRLKSRSSEAADLAYRRLELQLKYPDAIAVLNLHTDEAARFFDLLARQERRDAEREISGKDAGKELQQMWAANKAEQAALLGEARMADWNKYLNSLGARAELRELRNQLADSDYPLRRDQYEPLVALLAAEQVRHKGEREQLRHSMGANAKNVPPEEVIEYMDRRMDLIEESLARRQRAAATILDTEQLKRYQTMLDLQRLQSQVEYDSFVTVNAEAAAQVGRGEAQAAR